MFDARQTNEYRQTTVPDDWKDDILLAVDNAPKRTKHRPVTLIASLAACLVLLVFGAFVINAFTALPAVTTTVTQPPSVAVAHADISPRAYVTLTADGTIRVSTEDTALLWVEEHGVAVPFTERETTDTVTLEWTVSTEETVFIANGQPYTVTYDADSGWVTVSPIVPD